MTTKNVFVFLLILVSLKEMSCKGCWKQEREGLLGLKSRLGNLKSWVDGTDCCQWEGVECNTSTGRVAKLNLFGLCGYWDGHWHLNYSDFLVFEDLKSLNLSLNYISGCVESEGLENLEVLDLSNNFLNNGDSILSCLNGLSSLKSLYISFNDFNATSFHAFETMSLKLLNLEVLDVSSNYLTNDILPSLRGFTSLNTFDLSTTGLDSDLHIQGLSSMLINLEVLHMDDNNFSEIDIASALSGFSSLKSLTLGHSQLTPRSIRGISKLGSLEILDLAGNNLNNSILWCLENEGFTWPTNLQVLGLNDNSFSNDFILSLSGLQHLNSLDLSSNELDGSLDISGLLALSNLKILDLSSNNIKNFIVHQGSKSLSKLEVLILDGNKIDGSMLRKSLRAFSSIRLLSLRNNEFTGKVIAGDFRELGNLEHLVLDQSSNLLNEFFNSIGELTSLKVLSLSECDINGTLPSADWSELKKLEEFYLSYNQFVGPLPSSFGNMTSIRMLELSHNHFTGNFGSNLASLTSLQYLGFIENQFQVPISFTPFANLSNLRFIYGEGNKVILDPHLTLQNWVPKFQLQVLSLSSTTEINSLPFPNFLLYQYNLTSLDFTSCKLEGDFPNWLLENNTKMAELVLRNCSFTGAFQLPSHPLLSMWRMDVSDNAITGQFPSNNISSTFPNLQFLNMSMNAIHGPIPQEFGRMNSLDTLDLSDNHFSGEIPKNISGARSLLRFLKLSNNNLDGPVFPTLSILNHLEQLYLDGNSLSGNIPSSFSNTSLLAMDISNNHFAGKLPTGVGNLSNLVALSMSNNHLEGPIPTKFVELESLVYLDISGNNFTGSVPSFVNSSARFIHLNNNKLSGLAKRMFTERSALTILDLRYNEITSSIEDVIQDLRYTELYILLLKGNHFTGQIPKQLCELTDLTILDLSQNNLSGQIPSCLGNMRFENVNPIQLEMLFSGLYDIGHALPFVQEKAYFTTKKRSYIYTGDILAYMTGIDLSNNNLNGNIPSKLGNLTKIRALNLSHNYLTGNIPATFSSFAQIESLDLSFNKLSGHIPPQLSELTFLAVFSVAHNNLSGATPDRKGQFMTFDESSYEDNPFLCGPPLPKTCTGYIGQPSAILPNGFNIDGDNNDSLVDMYVFCVSFAVSYTSALLVIAASLYVNPYWRRAWFYYTELVITNCSYFIEDSMHKFSNIRNM